MHDPALGILPPSRPLRARTAEGHCKTWVSFEVAFLDLLQPADHKRGGDGAQPPPAKAQIGTLQQARRCCIIRNSVAWFKHSARASCSSLSEYANHAMLYFVAAIMATETLQPHLQVLHHQEISQLVQAQRASLTKQPSRHVKLLWKSVS